MSKAVSSKKTGSKKIEVGARIRYSGDMSNIPKCGTLTYVDPSSFKVAYDDGTVTPCPLPRALIGINFRLML